MATDTVDTVTLTKVINQCFANASDGRLSLTDQTRFLIEGKRLRGLLLNLLSAQFSAGTANLVAANADLVAVNAKLSDMASVLADTVQTLVDITNLVSNLDALFKLAVSFV